MVVTMPNQPLQTDRRFAPVSFRAAAIALAGHAQAIGDGLPGIRTAPEAGRLANGHGLGAAGMAGDRGCGRRVIAA